MGQGQIIQLKCRKIKGRRETKTLLMGMIGYWLLDRVYMAVF